MASFIVDVECYVMNGRPVEDNCRLIQMEEDRRSNIIDIKEIDPNIHRLGSLTIQIQAYQARVEHRSGFTILRRIHADLLTGK